jgi:hypothetical protein
VVGSPPYTILRIESGSSKHRVSSLGAKHGGIPAVFGRGDAFPLLNSDFANRSDLNEAVLHSVANEARRFVDVEFLHQSRAVRFRGFHADAQKCGDILRRFALGD